MEKHSFTPAFYKAVYKEIREADLEVETEDNAYGYFDLFLECGQYDVELTARFHVTTGSDDYFLFGHTYSKTYPVMENLIEIDEVKVWEQDGTPVEGFSIDDFWDQFNVNKSPRGFVKGDTVIFTCSGDDWHKGRFIGYNTELDCDVVEDRLTNTLYYINHPRGKIRKAKNALK